MKERVKAKQLFKQLKAGMISASDLNERELLLLKKYYFFRKENVYAV